MRVLTITLATVFATVFIATPLTTAGAQTGPRNTIVDLELVLAVDISLSMQLDEQRLQREGYVAAPSFPEIEPLVRERFARRQARDWLDDSMADPEVVRLRWPLPLLP